MAALAPKPLGASSAKYGVCEMCHEHAGDVFILRTSTVPMNHVFGHEKCLKALLTVKA